MTDARPILSVQGLQAHYGPAHILQNVAFEIGDDSVAVIGRNGMGKTTLCASIMGLMPSFRGSARGSIRFLGEEILGQGDIECVANAAFVGSKWRNAQPGYIPHVHPHKTTNSGVRLAPNPQGARSGIEVEQLGDRATHDYKRLPSWRASGIFDAEVGIG